MTATVSPLLNAKWHPSLSCREKWQLRKAMDRDIPYSEALGSGRWVLVPLRHSAHLTGGEKRQLNDTGALVSPSLPDPRRGAHETWNCGQQVGSLEKCWAGAAVTSTARLWLNLMGAQQSRNVGRRVNALLCSFTLWGGNGREEAQGCCSNTPTVSGGAVGKGERGRPCERAREGGKERQKYSVNTEREDGEERIGMCLWVNVMAWLWVCVCVGVCDWVCLGLRQKSKTERKWQID